MSKTPPTENSVTRYDEPEDIACKLQFLAMSLHNLQYWQATPTDGACAGLDFILSEIADVVRTFERGTA